MTAIESTSQRRTRICLFAKPPLAGIAKTRLANDIGLDAAAKLSRAFLADSWNAIRAIGWADAVLVASEDAPELRDLTGGDDDVFWLQGDGDLGARLARVMKRATGGGVSAIAMGADTPGLPVHRLEAARRLLNEGYAVLGPAADGGFYLLGLHCAPLPLFEAVAWGTDTVCATMIKRFATADIAVATLEPWFDIDRGADLMTFCRLLRSGVVTAPLTLRALVDAGIADNGSPR